jgi:hypothetical protein
LTASNADIKGDINTTSLKIDNKANLSIAQKSIPHTSFTINQMGYSTDEDALVTQCLQISSGYGLYIPTNVRFTGEMSSSNVDTGDIYASGKVLLEGNTYIHGWTRIDGAVTCASTLTATGKITSANNVEGKYLLAEGIELTASTPYIDFHVNNTTTDYTARIIQTGAGYLDFRRTSSVWLGLKALSFDVQSSIKVKKNVKNITEKEAKRILELRPVSFDYKNGGGDNQRGLIAEEVAEIYPEMVHTSEDGIPSIDYSKFVPYLIKMVQMQQKQIDALKSAK